MRHASAAQAQRPQGARVFALTLLLAACAAAVARPARAETLALHDLLRYSGNALTLLLADAELAAAQEDWNRTKAESGWKLSVQGGYGNTRDIIDETRSREFEAIKTEVSVSYPLLGAYAKEQREIELANGKMQQKRFKRDAALKIAQLELEDLYAAYWGAQEGLEVIDAYLRTEPRAGEGPREAQTAEEESDSLEAMAGYSKARAERHRLARRQDEARARLERLAGRALAELVVRGVQLPAMPELDLKRLQQDHPELASLRAAHASTRKQLDDSVWWGIDAAFDVTQSTITDRDDSQAGHGLFANVTVKMPLWFYRAGLAERRRLLAEMEALEIELKTKSEDIVGGAQDALAEHRELFHRVENLTKRTQAAGKALRASAQRRIGAVALTRRLRDYFAIALDEVETRARYWRSHVAVRSYLVVGAAEPAPEPTGPETTDVGTRLIEPLVKTVTGS